MELPALPPRTPSPPPVPSPSQEMSGSTGKGGVVGSALLAGQASPGGGHQQHNAVGTVILHGVQIVSLHIDGKERLCLAQISNTLLKNFSYNEIHNRRVALGITCVQCTPVQLEILRRAGAMPISSRRCGMITKREAERLVRSFLEEHCPPQLPENFAFNVVHTCGWGCKGQFIPARYNSSRAKCIKCTYCNVFFSPNKFIFHFHRLPDAKYRHPDAANFNSWRRHLELDYKITSEELVHAWEDVKAMFNGGSRKRVLTPGSPKHGLEDEGLIKRPNLSEARLDMAGPTPNPLANFNFPYPGMGQFLNNPTIAGPPGYLPPPAHPAFPFLSPNPVTNANNAGGSAGASTTPGQESHFSIQPTSPGAGNQKINMNELWKGKAPPVGFCNPFNLLWAKNMGLCNPEGMNPFRNVFDPEMLMRGRQQQQQQQQLAIEMKMSQQNEVDKNSRLSAFKPVGLFCNGSVYDNNKMSQLNMHSDVMGNESPDYSEGHSIGSAMSEVDDIDVNVTDILEESHQQTITRVMNTHAVDSSSANRRYSPREQNNNDDLIENENEQDTNETETHGMVSSIESTSCSGHMSSNTKNYSVEFLASTDTKIKCADDTPKQNPQSTDALADTPVNAKSDVDVTKIYTMSKEELQSQLIGILAKRDRLEKSVQFMKDSITQDSSQYENSI